MRKASALLLGVFTIGLLSGVGLSTTIQAAIRGSAVFTDVPSSHYADVAIGEMYELGVIKGKTATTFGPNDFITRADTALLLKRLRDEMKGIRTGTSSSSSRSSSSSSSSSSESSSSSSSSYNPGGVVRFAANEFTVEKNTATGKVNILVVRTGGNQGSGTIEYVFGSGGTAVNGQDYDAVSGVISFANKETSKQVAITIKNNTSASGNKTVQLKLKNPTGAVGLTTPNDIWLIIKDPNSSSSSSNSSSSSSSSSAAGGTIGFSALSYGVLEGQTLTLTVNRTGTTSAAANVNYATSDGSADSSDYSSVNGTLSFASGETTKTFTVSTSNNTSVDGNRTFNITLSSPTGGAVLGTASVVATINDDEIGSSGSGSVKFSTDTFTVTEAQGKATIIINRVGALTAASVNYATSNGSAIEPSDYTATSGTMSFAVGETSKSFTVPVSNDGNSENQETVQLTLSSPVGAALLSPYVGTLKISD